MKLPLLPIEQSDDNKSFITLVSGIIDEAASLEELIYLLTRRHIEIKLFSPREEDYELHSLDFEEERDVVMVVKKKKFLSDPHGEAMIPIPFNMIPTPIPRRTVLRTLTPLADSKAKITNPEWFTARNKRLKLQISKEDFREGDPYFPPAALLELVFSYALVPYGVTEIKWAIFEPDGYPRDGLKLVMKALADDDKTVFEERVYIRLDRLEVLIQKRKQKVMLSGAPSSVAI